MTMECRTGYRIKKAKREAALNRQRRNALLGLIMALVLIFVIKSGVFTMTPTQASGSGGVYVTVHRGETLWSIAGEYKEAGQDIRDFVRTIAAYNNMDGLMIYEGQELYIPR